MQRTAATGSPSRFRDRLRGFFLGLALITLPMLLPSVVLAQQTISTSTAGPIYGNGSSITVTTSGTIDGAGSGVISTGTNTTTALTNAGGILGINNGILNEATGSFGTITNSGSISGGYSGLESVAGSVIGTVLNTGTVTGGAHGAVLSTTGTVTNLSGALISGTDYDGLKTIGNVGLIDNAGSIYGGSRGVNIASGTTTDLTNSGSIVSGYTGVEMGGSTTLVTLTNSGSIGGAIYGMRMDASATLGTLTNSGTFTGGYFGAVLATTGTVTNLSGALISGTAYDGLQTIGNVGLIANAGSIDGGTRGVNIASGTTTDLTNSGSIVSGYTGVVMGASTTLGTLTNSGSIGGAIYGMSMDASATLGTLTNSGTFTGGNYGVVLATTGTLTNLSTGLIQGTSTDGIVVLSSANLALLDNAGTITGGIAAVRTQAGASIDRITNTGIMGMIVNEGTIGAGVAPAISSTGRGALIGSIVNTGTINQGFLIENQDVSVGAGVGVGVFNSGTLNVVNGNLTFTDGTIRLNADVSVNGGSGTLINQAILALSGSQTVTGNFQQTPGGTTLIDLLGVTAGSYGHLGISGAADFAGRLALDDTRLPGGLNGGQTFELFDFASYTGYFTALFVDGTSLTSLGGGQWAYGSLTLTEVWTATTMSLTVTGTAAVPEIDPNSFATAFALLVGAFGLLERKGRRLMRRSRKD